MPISQVADAIRCTTHWKMQQQSGKSQREISTFVDTLHHISKTANSDFKIQTERKQQIFYVNLDYN